MNYFIGWDVGAWHCSAQASGSKDALAILDKDLRIRGTPWEGNLSDVVLEAAGEKDPSSSFIKKVFHKCNTEAESEEDRQDAFYVAIDTPLGWPRHFRQLLDSWSKGVFADKSKTSTVNLRDNKIQNPFLHRKTESAIGQSLSAVQDQIGSQSTKAIYLLNALRVNRVSAGVWQAANPDITFIETYPAPCMRSFTFIDQLKRVSINERISSGDIFDAIICAFLARQYSMGAESSLVDYPPEDSDQEEGWIFTPKDCLRGPFGVSYGRLLGSQSPLKAFCELLSQVQIALIMKLLAPSFRQKAGKTKKAPVEPATSTLLTSWLNDRIQEDETFSSIAAEDLKALFKLLNPKAKPEQYPTNQGFAEIAKRIQCKVAP
ncbi:MAG: hypothetical protein FJ271_02355 [Planctomycetes bacterium]|nr:hypothetical protein [Planctomycetota bacterium]